MLLALSASQVAVPRLTRRMHGWNCSCFSRPLQLDEQGAVISRDEHHHQDPDQKAASSQQQPAATNGSVLSAPGHSSSASSNVSSSSALASSSSLAGMQGGQHGEEDGAGLTPSTSTSTASTLQQLPAADSSDLQREFSMCECWEDVLDVVADERESMSARSTVTALGKLSKLMKGKRQRDLAPLLGHEAFLTLLALMAAQLPAMNAFQACNSLYACSVLHVPLYSAQRYRSALDATIARLLPTFNGRDVCSVLYSYAQLHASSPRNELPAKPLLSALLQRATELTRSHSNSPSSSSTTDAAAQPSQQPQNGSSTASSSSSSNIGGGADEASASHSQLQAAAPSDHQEPGTANDTHPAHPNQQQQQPPSQAEAQQKQQHDMGRPEVDGHGMSMLLWSVASLGLEGDPDAMALVSVAATRLSNGREMDRLTPQVRGVPLRLRLSFYGSGEVDICKEGGGAGRRLGMH